MSERLTRKSIELLKPDEKERMVFDAEVRCLAVRILPSGQKSWVVRYTSDQGKKRKVTLGDVRALPPDEARKKALEIVGAARLGKDFMEEREARRRQSEAPTLSELWDRYAAEYLPMKKQRSRQGDEILWRRHIAPRMGETRIRDVSRSDVMRLQREMTEAGSPIVGNRAIALLSKMLNLAEEDGWEYRPRGSNPCFKLKRARENQRYRVLSPEELERLGEALESMKPEIGWQCIAAVKILLFTGARLGDVLGMEWDWINPHLAIIAIPDSKTGQKNLLLTPDVKAVLDEIPREEGCPYVLPGRVKGQHYINPYKPFAMLLARAKISNFKIHDLRHTYATYVAMGGHSQATVAKLLHHKRISTSDRYTNLMDTTQRSAAAQTTNILATHLKLAGE